MNPSINVEDAVSLNQCLLPPHGFSLHTASTSHTYALVQEAGALTQLASHLQAVGITPPKKLLVVTDSNLEVLLLTNTVIPLQDAGYEVHSLSVPAGEDSKSFASMERILSTALAAGLSRSDCFIALGGGVIGDLTGFCAASYYRGTPFIQVPTTLLAMVDSSVGGKVAINLGNVKNAIGAFYQPKRVVMDTDALSTLPERELKAGLAELLKMAWLERSALALPAQASLPEGAPSFLGLLKGVPVGNSTSLHASTLNANQWEPLLTRSCLLKAAVVQRDPEEKGLATDATGRVILNLGHTFAHAIEAEVASLQKLLKLNSPKTTVLHGEAVAMGLLLAVHCALRLGLLQPSTANGLLQRLQHCQLVTRWPAALPPPSPTTLLRWMLKDKKNQQATQVRLILPAEPLGTVTVYLLNAETQAPLLEQLWGDWLTGGLGFSV